MATVNTEFQPCDRANAAASGTTLKETAIKSGKVSEADYDRIIVPRNMIGEGVAGA